MFLLLLGATLYFGFDVGNVYWRAYQFQDAMTQESRFAARNSNEVIIAHLRAQADSLGLPDGAQKIQIRRKPNQIWIWCEYIETVELPWMVKDIDFNPHVERVF
ncbi:MAG: hypothetical protein JJD97_09105 [Gemmatimonadaceae bacterium]|nr:hypothetical protein [Gemmatimonadaceae bacterium]